MKNPHMVIAISNMETAIASFRSTLQMAAIWDDGKMDKREEKTLRRIDAAAEKFLAELKKAEQD